MASTSNSAINQGQQIAEQVSTPIPPANMKNFQRNMPGRQSRGKLIAKVPEGQELFLASPNDPKFEALIEKAFTDKTKLLKIVLGNDVGRFYRICLPRKMGKTLALKMFESFCDVEHGNSTRPDAARKLKWEKTEIYNEKQFFEEHFGRHPTIFITLWGVCGPTLNAVLIKFRKKLTETCEKFRYIYDELKNNDETPKTNLNFLEDILNNGAKNLNQWELASSLETLAKIVKDFHGDDAKTVLLLDEYDQPVSSLFLGNYEAEEIQKITEFHTDLMKTFKSNPYIDYAIVAGILKTGIVGTSGISFQQECNLLEDEGSKLNEFFGLSRSDIDEMVGDINKAHKEHGIVIDANVVNILWDWCNGYSYRYNGNEYHFCNPYACCVFLNDFVEKQRRTQYVDLPGLLKPQLNLNSLVANLKPLFEMKDITETLISILIWHDERNEHSVIQEKKMRSFAEKFFNNLTFNSSASKKGNKKPTAVTRSHLQEDFTLEDYKKIVDAIRNAPVKDDWQKVKRILLSYLCQVGMLTLRKGIVVVPNQEIRNQLHELLTPVFVKLFNITQELRIKVHNDLQQILRIDSLEANKFKEPMKAFKNSFTELIYATKHEPGSELFSHALLIAIAADIQNRLHFIPDESYPCQDGEILRIDMSFALKNENDDDSLTVVIVEMKYKANANTAVKEAIYYRKVYDEIAKNNNLHFARFIFIGINVNKRSVTMCYRIEDGTTAQPKFVTPNKMKDNKTHPQRRSNTQFPVLRTDFFEVK